jgi:hypothetical protein
MTDVIEFCYKTFKLPFMFCIIPYCDYDKVFIEDHDYLCVVSYTQSERGTIDIITLASVHFSLLM